MKPAHYAKLRKQFEQAETDLVRATRKWDKLRARVRRADAALDKEFAKHGEADLRDMIEPRPERAHLLRPLLAIDRAGLNGVSRK